MVNGLNVNVCPESCLPVTSWKVLSGNDMLVSVTALISAEIPSIPALIGLIVSLM